VSTWAWVLIAVLVDLLLVAVILAVAHRGRRGASTEEQQRQLEAAIASWIGQGWAIDSRTSVDAVLRRGEELMLVSVHKDGHVTTRPLANRTDDWDD
jgi:hypothetical protein